MTIPEIFSVFGVELSYLIERETGSPDPPAGAVPQILNMLLEEIETRGLTEEGICRSPSHEFRTKSLTEMQIALPASRARTTQLSRSSTPGDQSI